MRITLSEGRERTDDSSPFGSGFFRGLFQVPEISKSVQLNTPGCVKLLTVSEGGRFKVVEEKMMKGQVICRHGQGDRNPACLPLR